MAWNAIDCLRTLSAIGERELAKDDWWVVNGYLISQMCKQQVSRGGFNWRHGASYVTPYELTAIRYAVSNRLGSELLSTMDDLYQRLRFRSIAEISDLNNRFPAICQLLDDPHAVSLLVRVNSCSISTLASEQGGPPEALVALIEQLLAEDQADTVQQFNFQLSSPVSARDLSFFLINRTGGSETFPTYELVPTNSENAT